MRAGPDSGSSSTELRKPRAHDSARRSLRECRNGAATVRERLYPARCRSVESHKPMGCARSSLLLHGRALGTPISRSAPPGSHSDRRQLQAGFANLHGRNQQETPPRPQAARQRRGFCMRGKAAEPANSPPPAGVYFFFRTTTVPSWLRTASVTFPAASRLNSMVMPL